MKYQSLCIFASFLILAVCLTFAEELIQPNVEIIDESDHLFKRGIMSNRFFKDPRELEFSEEEEEDEHGERVAIQKRQADTDYQNDDGNYNPTTSVPGDLSEEGEVAGPPAPGDNNPDGTVGYRKQKGGGGRGRQRWKGGRANKMDGCFCPCMSQKKGLRFGSGHNRGNRGQRPNNGKPDPGAED